MTPNPSSSFIRQRLVDVRDALWTIPPWRVWRRCFIGYALFTVSVLPIGLAAGIVRPGLAPLSPSGAVTLLVAIAIHPAFGEELIFRALLLPRQRERLSTAGSIGIAAAALAAYLVSHPINAWVFRPGALALFTSPGYLACAALLGLTCTAVYWVSQSIWPAVVLHWTTAAVWLLCLGGQRLVGN